MVPVSVFAAALIDRERRCSSRKRHSAALAGDFLRIEAFRRRFEHRHLLVRQFDAERAEILVELCLVAGAMSGIADGLPAISHASTTWLRVAPVVRAT